MMRLASLILLIAAPALATEERRQWQFDVFLDDRPIGEHRFELVRDGQQLTLETRASFDVRFLFVTAFRYRHQNREVWYNGCLEAFNARTDNNGDILTVIGRGVADEFEVTSKQGRHSLEGCVKSFAYWNPAILEADRLLNAQTGNYEPVAIAFDGEDRIKVGGGTVAADRYRISVERGDILLWYTRADSTWVALDAPARGDRRIRYEATRIPTNANETEMLAGAQT